MIQRFGVFFPGNLIIVHKIFCEYVSLKKKTNNAKKITVWDGYSISLRVRGDKNPLPCPLFNPVLQWFAF